jgi:hypothetical protein
MTKKGSKINWELLVTGFFSTISFLFAIHQFNSNNGDFDRRMSYDSKKDSVMHSATLAQIDQIRASNELQSSYDSAMRIATNKQLEILNSQLAATQNQLKLQSEQYGKTISVLQKQADAADLNVQHYIDSRRPILLLELTPLKQDSSNRSVVSIRYTIKNIGETEASLESYSIHLVDGNFQNAQLIKKFTFGRNDVMPKNGIMDFVSVKLDFFEEKPMADFYLIAYVKYRDKIFNYQFGSECTGMWSEQYVVDGMNGMISLNKFQYDNALSSDSRY